MKTFYTVLLGYCLSAVSFSQAQTSAEAADYKEPLIANDYSAFFENAYRNYPEIPKGILEAVSFTNTRFKHLRHSANEAESCSGIPKAHGLMGLVLDGKNYFKNNLGLVSQLSGYTSEEIRVSPEKNILAFAKAYVLLKNQKKILSDKIEDHIPVLAELSELPGGDLLQNFAISSHIYSVLSFLNDNASQNFYGFPRYTIDLVNVFGEENYTVLSSSYIHMNENSVRDENGHAFKWKKGYSMQSPDYGPALWNPAADCNYSSRASVAVSAVVVHDTEGSYAGAISWFQNCNSSVSAHYVLRSSDGQITQMVRESEKAWHVGSENPYTIGLEHEGYAAQTGWYTNAMYKSSADLVKDICNSGYGIKPLRTAYWPWAQVANIITIGACTTIKGHQHYPNQSHTDPGKNWNWEYYYRLINPVPAATTYTAASGTFFDTGGAGANYGPDERKIWVISPANANTVTLEFASFTTENTWDYLFIYDGNSINAPLLGKFTGAASPGTIQSTGGSVTIEFRSDCQIAAAGWHATWKSTLTTAIPEQVNNLEASASPNPFYEMITVHYIGSGNETLNIRLTDVLGKEMILADKLRPLAGKNTWHLPLSELDLAEGIYMLKLSTPDKTHVLKLIRQSP